MADFDIPVNDNRIQYTAAGGETSFDYDFPLLDQSHLVVERTRSGTKTTGTITTHYSVSDVGVEAGGTVTLAGAWSPADADDIYTIYSVIPVSREDTDFQSDGDFTSADINRELDRLTQMVQERKRDLDRGVVLESDDDTTTPMTWPAKADRASKVSAFDADGLPVASTMTLSAIEAGATDAAASAATATAAAATATTQAGTATTQAGNAASSASAASVSAAAAASAAGSNLFNAVASLATADNAYTVVADTDDGTLFVCTMDGDLALNLPSIATAGEGERYGVLRAGASNTLTLVRNGSDTINGVAGTYTVEALDGTIVLVVADDATPDNWIVIPWTQAKAGSGLSQSGSTISLDLTKDQSWTGSQRATFSVVTDGTLDMNTAQNFKYTPSGADTLEFSNEANGQSGLIWLINTSGYAITLGGEVKGDSALAAAISVAGTYLLGYVCFDGTSVGVTRSLAMV